MSISNESKHASFTTSPFLGDDNVACSGMNEQHEKYYGAVAPAIIQTSLFVQKDYQSYCDAMLDEANNYIYTRGLNPTVELLESKLAKLEQGEACKCFASGMGAISSVLISLLNSGDHVLFINNIYGPALALAKKLQEKFGITYDILFTDDRTAIEEKLSEKTKLIYMESPGTMNMDIIDIQKITHIAKKRGILTAIDNTWATPIYQKPLTLGVDIVIHSCTKYLSGHSDVVAGAVISSLSLITLFRDFSHQLFGAALSPFNAWLILRGLRTLPIRMQRHQDNAIAVINYLKQQKYIENIRHPYLCQDKEKPIINKQMYGFSGLFSFVIKDADFSMVKKFIDACHVFKAGCSWGGYESLIISPNRGYNEKDLAKDNMAKGLIRISIGLEDPTLLIQDLQQAFQQMSKS